MAAGYVCDGCKMIVPLEFSDVVEGPNPAPLDWWRVGKYEGANVASSEAPILCSLACLARWARREKNAEAKKEAA